MTLRLTPITAALVAETAAEWQLLERQVPAGRWTTGTRADEDRLRAFASELGVVLREEGVVPWTRKRPQPTHAPSQPDQR